MVLTYYRDEHEWEGPGGALPSQARGTVDGPADKGYKHYIIKLYTYYILLYTSVNQSK